VNTDRSRLGSTSTVGGLRATLRRVALPALPTPRGLPALRRLPPVPTVAALLALLAAVAAALGLSSSAAASATPGANVFAGNWSITITDSGKSAGGTLTLKVVSTATGTSQLQGFGGTPCAAPTTYYYGSFSIPLAGANGTISGCTEGTDHLVARVSAGGDTGDGDVTFAAPNTFSGQLAYQGTSYPVTATFSSHTADDGCCPGGTTPPSNPPTTTTPPTSTTPGSPPTTTGPTPGGPSPNPSGPGGQSTTPTSPGGTSPTAIKTGSPDPSPDADPDPPGSGVVIAAEPAPGASATIASPNPLAATATTVAVRVGNSLGNFPGTTIVAPGELQTHGSAETLACWLLGPDAAPVPVAAYGSGVNLAYFRGRLKAANAFTACAGVAASVAATAGASPTAAAAASTRNAQTPAAGCVARRVTVAIQVRNGLIAGAQPVTPPAPAAASVKYACLLNKDGTLAITASSAHPGGLLATLGPALRFAVVRAPDAAARTATLVFRFGATWTGSWHSTRGTMRLAQNGTRVTGTYAACQKKATITGLLTGSTLTGSWTEPCDGHSGRLRLRLAADGQSFKGTWASGAAAPKLTWNATRTG
jgi:hypothetical protein